VGNEVNVKKNQPRRQALITATPQQQSALGTDSKSKQKKIAPIPPPSVDLKAKSGGTKDGKDELRHVCPYCQDIIVGSSEDYQVHIVTIHSQFF
jgi:hypothetical protein